MRDFVGKWRKRLRSKLLGSRKFPVINHADCDDDLLTALDMSKRVPVVITVRLEDCRWTGATGYRYGPGTTHPYVQTLLQYRERVATPIQDSFLWEYYQVFQPATLAEFQGVGGSVDGTRKSVLERLPPLNIYPWSGIAGKTIRKIADRTVQWPYKGFLHPSHVFVRSIGPQLPGFVEERILRLTSLSHGISETGFRSEPDPDRPYFDQFIVGDVMVRDGYTKIILANGQHRASVLSSLGHNTAPILVGVRHHRGPSVIRRDEVKDWPLVRDGLYDVDEALKVFDGIFDGCGPRP